MTNREKGLKGSTVDHYILYRRFLKERCEIKNCTDESHPDCSKCVREWGEEEAPDD